MKNEPCKRKFPMRIRDLQWEGIAIWPPHWGISDEEAGEEGILKKVQLHYDQTPSCISVVVFHHGDSRSGVIILKNLADLENLCKILRRNLNRPLAEIGDLLVEFPHAALQERNLRGAQ